MTKDDILLMALDAEFVVSGNLVLVSGYGGYVGITDKLTSFAALVAAKAAAEENEACALVCEGVAKEFGGVAEGTFVTDFGKHTHQAMAAGAMNGAAAIRARHNTQKEKSE